MRVEDKIQDMFEIETVFSLVEDSLQANVEISYDALVRIVFQTPLLRNKIYKHASNELRFMFSWYDNSWQDYLVHICELDNQAIIKITQATNYKVEGGIIINE